MSITIETDRWGNKFVPRTGRCEAWERGLEHIEQEGSSEWQKIREKHGLTPEDLESISSGGDGGDYSVGGHVFWEEVRMAEDRPGIPKLEHICLLAWVEGTSPGALLDRVLIERGQELMAEES